MAWGTAPGNENAAAVSGGGGRSAATPDDETVVAGSGVPGNTNMTVEQVQHSFERKHIAVMSTTFSSNSQILIVDRNPNVREFLKRELTREGFSVLLAGTGKELLALLSRCDSIDLLILDPDIPDVETHIVIEAIRKRLPDLPIIVHGFISDASEFGSLPGRIIPIEKQGNSVDQLKDSIARLFTPKLHTYRNGNSV